MKYDFLFVQIYLVYISISNILSQQCQVKRCAVTGTEFQQGQCINFHKNNKTSVEYYEIDHRKCNSTIEFCPHSFENKDINCAPKPADLESGIDGTPCTEDNGCYSKACDKTTGKCLGKKQGITCQQVRECAIGFYCQNNTVCQPQVAAKGSCNSDLDCQNNLGCFQGFCVPYLSLDDGTTVDVLDYRLCKSYKVRDGQCVSTTLLSPDGCVGNQTMCNYTYTVPGQPKNDFQLPCKCGVGLPDKTFCQYGSLSSQWKDDMVPKLKSWYDVDSKKQHTVKRHDFDKDLQWKVMQTNAYPDYRDADECVKKFYVASGYISLQIALVFLLTLLFV